MNEEKQKIKNKSEIKNIWNGEKQIKKLVSS